MNIANTGGACKPAPHIENTDDAMIAELERLDKAGLLACAAPTAPPAISATRTSRHACLGQDAAEITEWRERWHRENPGKPPVDSARYYAREIYKFRPEKADDPEGFREWKDRLSPAQADTLEEANEPKLEAKRALWREEYRLKILIEENRVVTPYQRNPTPERKREQGRDRQAEFMAKKTDEERKAISNGKQRAKRARDRLAAQAAPVTTPASVATSAPVLVPASAIVAPAAAAPAVALIDHRIAGLQEGLQTRSNELAKLDLSDITPGVIAKTSAWFDLQSAQLERARAAKIAAEVSADPGSVVAEWFNQEMALADDDDTHCGSDPEEDAALTQELNDILALC